MYRAIIIARASTDKQVIQGDTLDDQIHQCKDYIERQGWKLVKTFPLAESGRKIEREYFQEVIDFCKSPTNKINYFVFKNISRFTRKGDEDYLKFKNNLEESGVKLRDIYGTIKDKINTLEKYGLEYDWSRYSPSQGEETYQANKAKDTVRDSLTQMIGAEIDYVRKGYWNREAPYGFRNQKIDTQEEGRRNILIDQSKESFFIKKMFELRAEGILDDKNITSKVNQLGFKTRKFCRRDKKTKKVIGYSGNNGLTAKHLQQYIRRPIYAGIICEKWTHYQPVKAKFKGLVNIDTFNQVNRGKVSIEDNGKNIQIKYNQKPIRRLKNNPLYPFKCILCPICNKPLTGSSSRGKAGTEYPAYHCSRDHKLWRLGRKKFHEEIYEFIHKIKFSSEFIKLFEVAFIEVWKKKRLNAVEESKKAGEYVSRLLTEQKTVLEAFKTATGAVIRQELEKDYEKLENKIKKAREERDKKETSETDIKIALKHALYFMEHLEELLIDEANPFKQRQLFSLIFEEMPNYEEVVNGTPKLEPIFELNSRPNISKSQLVTPAGFEPAIFRMKT